MTNVSESIEYTLEYEEYYPNRREVYYILENGERVVEYNEYAALYIDHGYKEYWLRGTGRIYNIDKVLDLIVSMRQEIEYIDYYTASYIMNESNRDNIMLLESKIKEARYV